MTVKEALDELEQWVQHQRDEGEADLRSILYKIQSLRQKDLEES